jgi:hypothetical protein
MDCQKMEMESFGKMLPEILFPHVQRWAERSGFTLLTQLLVDEQFRALLEKYGDQMVRGMARRGDGPVNGSAHVSSKDSAYHAEPPLEANASDFTDLQNRVLAMEAQQEAQQALLGMLRSRMRPLALALGCCPECLVGAELCPSCSGRSKVAYCPPDYTLLEALVVKPLAASGVPLVLNEKKASVSEQSKRGKGANHGRTNDTRELPLGQ